MPPAAPADLYRYIQEQGPVIENYIEQLAQYGSQPGGGIVRPVYSPPWQQAHNRLAEWMEEAGLKVYADGIGNLWGRLEGQESGNIIASGSHIDTVKGGGKYDGALGVIAALAALRFLKELYGAPKRTLEVVALCEEEGSRFSNTFLGSRAITGTLSRNEVETSRDAEGISIEEAARASGFDPATLEAAKRDGISTFIELHIEQGRILDDEKTQVGIVQAITGLQHLLVTFSGRADHAGTTPMDLRSDALVAAAEAITRISKIAADLGRPAVATVGTIELEPGAKNIVPASVTIAVDLRHSNTETKNFMSERIQQSCREAAEKQGTGVEIELLMDRPPAPMTARIVDLLQSSAGELKLSQKAMVSGAGHDSQVMVEKFETSMVFVPSKSGRSHSSAEYTPVEEILPGIAVLARALYRLAYEDQDQD